MSARLRGDTDCAGDESESETAGVPLVGVGALGEAVERALRSLAKGA